MSWRMKIGLVVLALAVIAAAGGWYTWFRSSPEPAREYLVPPTETGLVVNGSMESPDDSGQAPRSWHTGSWGSNEADFSYVADAHTGHRSLKIEVDDYQEGDAKWLFESVDVSGYAMLRYQDFYKSNVATHVIAQIELADGSLIYPTIGTAFASKEWSLGSFDFAVPEGAIRLTVLHVLAADGWLMLDDVRMDPYLPQPLKGGGMVSITFDDGYASLYSTALPMLQRYDLVSTDYIITDWLGRPNYVTAQQVQMVSMSGQEIGSHTVSHPYLSELDHGELEREVVDSKQFLFDLLGIVPTAFASPYGDYSSQVQDEVSQVYQSHRTVNQGFNSPDSFDPYHIRVQNVKIYTPVEQIEEWIDFASQHNIWLVLVFHNIAEGGDADSYLPQNLDIVLDYLSQSGLQVCTVSQGVEIMASQ